MPPSHREDALTVVKRLRDNGHIAYFAGGCVRDMLLKIEPKDYDVATDAPPEVVRKLFSNTQAVGAAFGVILVRLHQSQIEVATFRTDGNYADGRRPAAVQFTTAEEDAKRRDFTINGVFFDPIGDRTIDYVAGQRDLQNRILRAIGDPTHRFAEDHLRLLRAVRFAARFNLTIEPLTAQAIQRHAEHLKRISPERIAEELRLMLTPASRVHAYRLLREFGLDRIILRFLPDCCEHGEVFAAIAQPEISIGLALGAMVLDARPAKLLTLPEIRTAASSLRQALKISNEESDRFEGSLSFARLLLDPPPTVATMKRFLAQPFARDAQTLMQAVGRTGILTGQVQLRTEQLRELEKTDVAPPPLLTGDDLTAARWTPGPLFKRVLDAVYDAQLEDRIQTHDQALQMAEELRKHAPPRT